MAAGGAVALSRYLAAMSNCVGTLPAGFRITSTNTGTISLLDRDSLRLECPYKVIVCFHKRSRVPGKKVRRLRNMAFSSPPYVPPTTQVFRGYYLAKIQGELLEVNIRQAWDDLHYGTGKTGNGVPCSIEILLTIGKHVNTMSLGQGA